MVNIGTLSAFIIVSFSIPLSRKLAQKGKLHIMQNADHFRVPLSPVLPILSGVVCIWLTLQLSIGTWVSFSIWLTIGIIIYAVYGYRRSSSQR
jgi:APA family basic amino acid/polyamine antiporter